MRASIASPMSCMSIIPKTVPCVADRLRVFPEGCFTLRGGDGAALGYALTHPWMFGAPPALNAKLGGIPAGADTYYIHDIAMLPETRGSGLGSVIIGRVFDVAMRLGLRTLSLVAVNNSGASGPSTGFSSSTRRARSPTSSRAMTRTHATWCERCRRAG